MVARPSLTHALIAVGLSVAAVLFAVPGAAVAAPKPKPSPTPTATAPATPGASILDADRTMILGWASHDLATMAAEEAAFGRTNGMLSTYVDFVQSPGFPHAYADAAKTRRSALLIAWEPWDWNRPADQQPEFAPRRIAAGEYDAYLTSWLTAAAQRSADAEIIVRFAPEMDDSSRPWSSSTAPGGNTPAEYIVM